MNKTGIFVTKYLYMRKLYILLIFSVLSLSASAVNAKTNDSDSIVRILAIGNSFSVDALENHFYELATAAGKKVIVGNMYIGGCSLEKHLNNSKQNKAAYTYYKRGLDGINVKKKGVTLEAALTDEEWDFVSFQQKSGISGIYETWEESLPALLEYVKSMVSDDTVMMIHQTWAYAEDSTHKDFKNYDNDQMKMYGSIIDAVKRVSKLSGIKLVIPSGTAVQNARTTSLKKVMTRDGYHLHKTYGRYVAACVWLEKVLGVNSVGNTYRPEMMSPEQQRLAQIAAHKAVRHPWRVSKVRTTAKTVNSKIILQQ